jgi:hypothetical protein
MHSSRGAGRKPGASVYTWKSLSHSLSQFTPETSVQHAFELSMPGRAVGLADTARHSQDASLFKTREFDMRIDDGAAGGQWAWQIMLATS